jgi:hypothetical protein
MAVMEPKFSIPLVPFGVLLGIAAAVLFIKFGPKPEDHSKDAGGTTNG